MKLKNYLGILLLFIVLMCCMNNISAITDDNMNIVSEIDYSDDSISVSNEINLDENTQILNAQKSNDEINDTSILGDDSEPAEDDTDDNSIDDDEGSTFSFMDDIKESTTGDYYRFVNYLVNDCGFEFRNDSLAEDGYIIYSTQTYHGKYFDNEQFTISPDETYFVSIGEKEGYFINGNYYEDIIYLHNNQYYLKNTNTGETINNVDINIKLSNGDSCIKKTNNNGVIYYNTHTLSVGSYTATITSSDNNYLISSKK